MRKGKTRDVGAGALMSAKLNSGPSNPVTLIREQTPASTIVVGKKLPAAETYAAQELRKYLGKISGAQIPIQAEGKAVPGCKILLGTLESNRSIQALQNQLKEVEGLGEDGFLIATLDGNLVIVGGGTGGVLYGVYTFLEKYLGCRWYFPSEAGEVIPKRGTIQLEATRHSEQPSLSHRGLITCGVSQDYDQGIVDWMARNKMNAKTELLDVLDVGIDPSNPKITMTQCEGMRSRAVMPHTIHHSFWWLVPSGRYYDKHPEYFPLLNGKRVRPWDANVRDLDARLYQPNGHDINTELCLSNPDVVAICVEKTRAFFAKHPEIKTMGIQPNDNYVGAGWCDCDSCKAMGRTRTDQLAIFVNRVAAEIHKTNPDKYVGFLAYSDCQPPSTIKPLDNVIVEYVNNERCDKHALNGPECKDNATRAREVEAWLKMVKPDHFLWSDFMTPGNDLLMAMAGALARDMKWFHELGIAGFETIVTPGTWGTLKLNNYVTAKVSWDVSLKYENILDDFCKNFYGPAAKPMRKYYLAVDRAMQESPGCSHRADPSNIERGLTPQVQKELNGCLLEAERLAAASSGAAPRVSEGNTAHADRVARERAQLERWTALLERRKQAKQAAMASKVRVLPAVKPLPPDADLHLWERQGQPVTNFIETSGQGLAHEQTFCWVRYDRDNLYVVFKCQEPNLDRLTRCAIAHNGPVWEADEVELFIDPGNSKNNYYQFGSDSAGNTFDTSCSKNPYKVDFIERSIPWKARASLGKDCWYAEMRIPLNEVGLTPSKGTSFGINLNRTRRAGGGVDSEPSGWPNGKFHEPEAFGTASFE